MITKIISAANTNINYNVIKMRHITIIFIIFSILACNKKSKEYESLIEKFEIILGENESIYLNEIVTDFDNYLILNHIEQKNDFKKYLESFSEMKVKNIWRIDSLNLKKYKESKLFSKYDSIYPDSVWFDGNTYKIIFTSYFCGELIPSSEELIPSKSELMNIDSTINSLKRKPILTKSPSNFIIALDSIQQKDSLIITYLDYKHWVDVIYPENLARGLLYFLSEENEYFAKRIFVMEMLD
jgi:hypothetical protein